MNCAHPESRVQMYLAAGSSQCNQNGGGQEGKGEAMLCPCPVRWPGYCRWVSQSRALHLQGHTAWAWLPGLLLAVIHQSCRGSQARPGVKTAHCSPHLAPWGTAVSAPRKGAPLPWQRQHLDSKMSWLNPPLAGKHRDRGSGTFLQSFAQGSAFL